MGLEGTAYIYPEGSPEEALYFPLYPDKQSVSGGTVLGRKTIPGFARQVITPLSRKSVDQKISMLFSDAIPPRRDRAAPPPNANSAFGWLIRHLGPGEEGSAFDGEDDSNVFVVKLLEAPQMVVVERWSAELQILRPDGEVGNEILQMRVEMDLLHYTPFAIDTSIFGLLKGQRPKRKPRKHRYTKQKRLGGVRSGNDISEFVPPAATDVLSQRLSTKEVGQLSQNGHIDWRDLIIGGRWDGRVFFQQGTSGKPRGP